MPIYLHFILVSTIVGCDVELIEFPVFKPNEYFFKHHQREGEEKWRTYARAIREIMTDNTGLVLCDNAIEEKYEYKKLLFPDVKAKMTD